MWRNCSRSKSGRLAAETGTGPYETQKGCTTVSTDPTDATLVNFAVIRRLIADMSSLVEGKALAQRQVLQLLLQQMSAVAGRDLSPEFIDQLDALRQAAVMMGEDNETFRKAWAAEMSAVIDALSN